MRNKIKYILLVIVAICLCFYLYLRFGGYFFIEKEYRENVAQQIKNAPEMPDQFYELYEVVYPNSLNKGILSYLIERSILSNRDSESTTLTTASILTCCKERYLLAFYLEDQTTHKQCLSYEAGYIDFLYNNRGILSAAQYYFKKDLDDLDEKEMLTLIIMMKNPSLYNPIRHPARVEKRINSILERRKKQKKSHTLMQLFNIL